MGEKLGVKVDDTTAGALALSLQAMRDACKDEATSSVRGFTLEMHCAMCVLTSQLHAPCHRSTVHLQHLIRTVCMSFLGVLVASLWQASRIEAK